MNKFVSLITALLIAFGFAGATFAAENVAEQPVVATEQVIEKVNINSANAETLAKNLHRVGLKKAEAIITWRESNGNFTSVEQLLDVKGIGEGILDANRDRVIL